MSGISDSTLKELIETYHKELERRAGKEKNVSGEQMDNIGLVGKSILHSTNDEKKECKNCKELQKRVVFWRSGYFRLSAEIKDMLDNRFHHNVELNLHVAKETIDILSDKLIDYENKLKKLNGGNNIYE